MARRVGGVGGTLVLDSEGVVKAAAGKARVRAYLQTALRRRARVVVSAVTLTEVLRGTPRDAAVHRVLGAASIVPVTPDLARHAGELLGATGLGGHRCAIDALVAATALAQSRPVVLLTSDPDDLHRLVEEPGEPKERRVVVVRV
ncbi:type II toxin-antitoxin system VapC family toxin [Carbonactinospora thermoautotrophica]|uniref:type II toxin-antitoxin system VapC family toxin n=1 Tax=Carbonactinospora thermoautotrophica TaxID=1469144 RepID=UPI000B262FB0|nr:PIN domain-containing protein [Carbonactinospora thermoautotrophica]